MNYALFTDWTKDRIEELVSVFGVPRDDAEDLVRYLKNGCIAAEAEARNDSQFLLDLREIGSAAMAKREGKSQQCIRKRRQKLLNKRNQIRTQELRA